MTPYDVGVNYWPARSAMRWWREFAAEDFSRDARTIADAGGTSVRVFLLWEDFQPTMGQVSSRALGDLRTVADICAAEDLALIPTLFTGHMSGANWLPRWATEAGEPGRFPIVSAGAYAQVRARSWFADDDIIRAQELLAREAATALRGHPALRAWDLGNENSNVCVPDTREAGRAWLRRMRDALRAGDPECRVTIGLHMEDLEQDRRIGPAEAAEVCDFLCMHGYPLYAPWARSSTDPTLPAFLAEVTRWLGGGKDVYFEEFGMPTPTSDDESQADVFIAESLDLLYEAGTMGAMLWCFSDYVPALWAGPPFDVAPHERFFGLWRADGTAKPAARHFGRYANVQTREPRPSQWHEVERESFYADPFGNLVRLYEGYARVAAL